MGARGGNRRALPEDVRTSVMPTIRIFRRRIRDSIRARRLDRDLQQQIASHLDEAAEEYVRRGLSPADARRAALRRFGDVARVHEAWRDARSFLALESLKRDVRHATRSLRRNPGFSFVVMGVLAIGTGALTFVFALLNGVVLRPLPFCAPPPRGGGGASRVGRNRPGGGGGVGG